MSVPKIKINLPADFTDRFPDGDYTVGRGADPRGKGERTADVSKREKLKAARRGRSKTVRPVAV